MSTSSFRLVASASAPGLLASFTLFSQFPAGVLSQWANQVQQRTYAKGQPLFSHGDNIHHLHLVQSGWVKLSRLTLSGTEAVLDIVGPGQSLALMDMFAQAAYTSTATAVEAATILTLPAESFRQALTCNPAVALNLLQAAARQQTQLMQELEGRTLQKAPQRLGCFLLKLVPGNPAPVKGPVTLHLPYDKTLLAARLGMQPETFSRALTSLKKELGFTVRGSTITLPRAEALIAYTCSACSGVFPCNGHHKP